MQNPIGGFDTGGAGHWAEVDSSGDLHVVVDSGGGGGGGGVVTQSSGANLHTNVDNFPATQPVSGVTAVASTITENPVLLGASDASSNKQMLQVDAYANLKIYLSSLLTGEDQVNNILGVATKPIIGSVYSYSRDVAYGTAVTHTSKSAAGQLMTVTVSNVNASARWLQFYDSTGSTSGTPVISVPIPAGTATAPSSITLDRLLGANGDYFATGITWAISTVQATYSAATAADHNINVRYV